MLRLFYLISLLMLTPGLALSEDLQPPPYTAGFSRISVSDEDSAFDTMIWYPSSAPEKPWQAGPFTVAATLNAGIATDRRFPIILLSHGSGGTPMAHRELAASLARKGMVVVAPLHVGDAAGHPRANQQAKILMDRPRQASKALNAVLADKRFAPSIDAGRLGMVGFSAGGYTSLVLAGARPNFDLALAYCAGEGRSDVGSCRPATEETTKAPAAIVNWKPDTEPRIKALVLMDPLAILFDQESLASVKVPVLLFRPQDGSFLRAKANALAVAENLPSPPEQVIVPGAHFVFIDPCPAELAAEAPMICKDAAGIDRAAIHQGIERDVADLLRRQL